MKLLVVTQVVDREDPVLGFFHAWIEALAARIESVHVICLKEGVHSLPANVQVYSLGKEKGSKPGIVYAGRFLSLVWKLRHEYDRVFVHMNQEYILIAGWLWELLNKPVYMWRNHYAGSWRTDLAASTCTKVFCTSKYSYTAKYKKTVIMPVGVDTERFSGQAISARIPHSILFLARMSPSKNVGILLDALEILKKNGTPFTASLYGDPLPGDALYYASLIERVHTSALSGSVTFHAGIPNADTPPIYAAHKIFVNCSPSGMFDKTLFEAAASGCLVLASSLDFRSLAGIDYYFEGETQLADRLEALLSYTGGKLLNATKELQGITSEESLTALGNRLVLELAGS